MKDLIPEFWAFARARQQLLYTGETDDPILQKYRFTNCYRICDRVSQYMLRVAAEADSENVGGPIKLWRVLLYKIFNRIDTWEYLTQRYGPLTPETPGLEELTKALRNRVNFAPAYRMCIGRSTFGHREKHANWLEAVYSIWEYRGARLLKAESVQEAYGIFFEQPMFGKFLAMQLATDMSYIWPIGAGGFVVAGPGSRRGIHTVFAEMRERRVSNSDADDDTYTRYIARMWADQAGNFEPMRIGPERTLPLSWMDVQNLFCEFDKYTRIKDPSIKLVSNKEKKRPKQNYTPSPRGRMRWPEDFVFGRLV